MSLIKYKFETGKLQFVIIYYCISNITTKLHSFVCSRKFRLIKREKRLIKREIKTANKCDKNHKNSVDFDCMFE